MHADFFNPNDTHINIKKKSIAKGIPLLFNDDKHILVY